jgi:AAA domain/RepB DNA-primase from phage plasmid
VTLLTVAENSISEVHDFLDFLFGDSTGYIYVPYRVVNKGAFTQQFYQWPEQKGEAADWILGNTTTHEVYVAPAMFTIADSRKEFFKSTRTVWCEFDGPVPVQLKELPQPSVRIASGGPGHEHWYWTLAQATNGELRSATDIESVNRAITYTFGADSSGWDCNQVLRAPGTLNHKRSQTVRLVMQNDSTVELSQFQSIVADLPKALEFDATVIPDVADVILKYAWPPAAVALYRQKVGESKNEGRSGALFALACYCAEMHMADNEIYAVIRNADDRWDKFKGRTDRHQRLLSLIQNVRVKHPDIEVAEDVYPVFGFRSLLETTITLEWVIEGLLEANGYLLLVGPSGVGKTQWSIRWAINLALGRNYMGYQTKKPQRILFISCEMNHEGIKFFMEIQAKGLTSEELQTLEQNLLVAPIGEPLLLDTDGGQSILTGLIDYHKPDGLIFDSVGSATDGDLSSEKPVKALMGFNDHLRVKYGIWTWYVHHQRKAQGDNKKPNKLSDVYGNQYLVNRATTVICMWPNSKDNSRIEVTDLKVRLAPPDSVKFDMQRLPDLDFLRLSEVKFQTKHLEYHPSPGVIPPVDTDMFEGKAKTDPKPDLPPATQHLQGNI